MPSAGVSIDEDNWQNILTSNPLNVVTWPHIAHTVILASRNLGWLPHESMSFLKKPSYGEQTIQLELLFLCYHC
jgi:hypothetical protein